MAYMDQERKEKLAPSIKAVLNQYSLKGSISVRNHSTLVVSIKSGKLDFIKNMMSVAQERPYFVREEPKYLAINEYWISENYTGIVRDCLLALKTAMNDGNHDNSDIMTDYFDVGWYIEINVGKWNKPYVLEA